MLEVLTGQLLLLLSEWFKCVFINMVIGAYIYTCIIYKAWKFLVCLKKLQNIWLMILCCGDLGLGLHLNSLPWVQVCLHFSGKQTLNGVCKRKIQMSFSWLFHVFTNVPSFLRFHLMKPGFIFFKWPVKFVWSPVLLMEFHTMKNDLKKKK